MMPDNSSRLSVSVSPRHSHALLQAIIIHAYSVTRDLLLAATPAFYVQLAIVGAWYKTVSLSLSALSLFTLLTLLTLFTF